MAIVNLQLDSEHHLRCEDQHDGTAMLSLVKKGPDGEFEFLTVLSIPPQQRNNLADFLLPCQPPNSLT